MTPQTVSILGLILSLGLAVSAFPAEQPENGKHWVVIVAGSNGWYNYRHQVGAHWIFPSTRMIVVVRTIIALHACVFLYMDRLTFATPIRLSTRMESQMSRLW